MSLLGTKRIANKLDWAAVTDDLIQELRVTSYARLAKCGQ